MKGMKPILRIRFIFACFALFLSRLEVEGWTVLQARKLSKNRLPSCYTGQLRSGFVPSLLPEPHFCNVSPLYVTANGEDNIDAGESQAPSRLQRAKKAQRIILLALIIVTIVSRAITSGLAFKLIHTLGTQFTLKPLSGLFRNNIGKLVKWGLVGTFTALALDAFRTSRRQAKDLTSEWGRYSRHPNLRGLATTHMLLLQVLPLAVLGRFFPRIQRRAGQAFANGLLKIGPLYVKMGQIISSQSQLLPAEWRPAMERLQDQVPAQAGEKARALAFSVWPGGEEAFNATFVAMDWNPIAAASLGQVHRAVIQTLDGQQKTVAVKLQRPYLREIYNNDFAMLKGIAKVVDRFFGSSAGSVGGVAQSWSQIFENAEEILYREIDYRDEAANCVRFANDFGLGWNGTEASAVKALARSGSPLPSAASWLRTPLVYSNMTSEQVLVMEYVPSIKITDLDALGRANVTMADREYLADCLGRAYLRQFCANGFCKGLCNMSCLVLIFNSCFQSFHRPACGQFGC